MPKPNSIAVIMANRNGSEYIEQAISSILAQTCSNLTLIVVDDASEDDSVERVATLAESDARIKLIARRKVGGASVVRNDAIAAASADWIAICDSDDVLHPDRLQRMLNCALREGVDMVADDAIHFATVPMQAPCTVLGLETSLGARLITLTELAQNSAIGYLKPLIRRSLLSKRPYDEGLQIGEDYQLYFDLLLEGAKFHLMPEALYFYRRHPNSLSFRSKPDQVFSQINRLENVDLSSQDKETQANVQKALRQRLSQLRKMLQRETFARALKTRNVTQILTLFVKHPLTSTHWMISLIAKRSAMKHRTLQTSQGIILTANDGKSRHSLGQPPGYLALPAPDDGNQMRSFVAHLNYLASQGPLEIYGETPKNFKINDYLPAVWASRH